MSIVDWAAEKVQNFSGETERRELVAEYKEALYGFKTTIANIVCQINVSINEFNLLVSKINKFRQQKVKKNIDSLYLFLNKFGNAKMPDKYSEEASQSVENIPFKQIEDAEFYFQNINWDEKKVFNESFKRGVFGTRNATRKLNEESRVEFGKYKIQWESVQNQAHQKNKRVQDEIKIADLYHECINQINKEIEAKIFPELELVQAMLDAESVKNYVVADLDANNIKLNRDVSLLKNSLYDKHYQFVKNTFLFYIISAKIYDTPVLTNLINNATTSNDYNVILLDKRMIEENIKMVNYNILKEVKV
jgi:hypothetical protein